jgi:hypothetical protein
VPYATADTTSKGSHPVSWTRPQVRGVAITLLHLKTDNEAFQDFITRHLTLNARSDIIVNEGETAKTLCQPYAKQRLCIPNSYPAGGQKRMHRPMWVRHSLWQAALC